MEKRAIDQFYESFNHFETEIIGSIDWESWEAIRYDVFCYIRNNILRIDQNKTIQNNTSVLKRLSKVGNLSKFIIFSLRNRKKCIFFAASRYKNDSGYGFDPNIDDVINILKNDYIILDSVTHQNQYIHHSTLNIIPALVSLFQRFYKKPKNITKLYIKVSEYFGVNIKDIKIGNIISRYYIEKQIYRWYFKLMKPSAVFLTQNGIQKGMYKAAKLSNTPIVEFQHGLVNKYHPAYSYPNCKDSIQLAIPDYFFAYSSFWKKNIAELYPVKEIIVSGNSFVSKIINNEIVYDLTFICNPTLMSLFLGIIYELRAMRYRGKICLKLHPNQSAEKQEIQQRVISDSNISVIANEISIQNVIGMSKVFVAVQSTAVYEILNAGKQLFIFKDGVFEDHKDIFNNPLVTLVKNSKELFDKLNSDKKPESTSVQHELYFEPFKTEEVKSFLKNLDLDV